MGNININKSLRVEHYGPIKQGKIHFHFYAMCTNQIKHADYYELLSCLISVANNPLLGEISLVF